MPDKEQDMKISLPFLSRILILLLFSIAEITFCTLFLLTFSYIYLAVLLAVLGWHFTTGIMIEQKERIRRLEKLITEFEYITKEDETEEEDIIGLS